MITRVPPPRSLLLPGGLSVMGVGRGGSGRGHSWGRGPGTGKQTPRADTLGDTARLGLDELLPSEQLKILGFPCLGP